MSVKPAVLSPNIPTDDKIRQQMERILQSRSFTTVARLKRFLIFIVEETVQGRGDLLKEFVVGVEVFSKEDSFDPRKDPIVRVQARRLRARLARYYQEEGQSDPLVIDLPKGGYAPIFRTRGIAAQKRHSPALLAARNTITVRPFADLSPGGDLAYLGAAVQHEIIGTLTKAEVARVVSWDTHRSVSEDTDERQESAALVVEGSVQRLPDHLRATIHLVDGATGVYLWSDSIVCSSQEPFELQQRAAETVLNRVHDGLMENRWRKTSRATENLAAWNLLQQGRYQLSQRTEESLRKAVELFERVLVEDPRNSSGFSGLADSYSLLGHYGVLSPVEVWNHVASNAASAILEDDHSAEAHTSLAHAKASQDWDWEGAEREFRLAIQLDPRYSTAHHWYAMSCLVPIGRLDQALDEIHLAQVLDPISSIVIRDVAAIHYYRREFDEALEQCDHTIELNPHFSPAYWTLGLIQEQRGDFEEAAAAFHRALQLTPQNPRIMAALGHTLAVWGKEEQAREILFQHRRLADERYVSPFNFAALHFALGEKKEGYEWLEKAVQDRCFELTSLNVNPQFDSLREEPPFRSVVARLGL